MYFYAWKYIMRAIFEVSFKMPYKYLNQILLEEYSIKEWTFKKSKN